jgi:hypothetical protein
MALAEHEQYNAERDKTKWKLDNTTVRAPVSGTILTKGAEDEKQAIAAHSVEDKLWAGKFDELLIRYPVPLKGGASEQRLALNWLFPNFNRKELKEGQTIRAVVTERFVAHGKTVSQEVVSKVTNTELFLCFCQAENERRYPTCAS